MAVLYHTRHHEHKSNNQCIQFGSLHVQIQILLHTLGFPRVYSSVNNTLIIVTIAHQL